MLFAEEKSRDSKGIVYLFDFGNGNLNNGPSYKEKDGENCPNPEYLKDHYQGDLLIKNETNWFEFEWNVNNGRM